MLSDDVWSGLKIVQNAYIDGDTVHITGKIEQPTNLNKRVANYKNCRNKTGMLSCFQVKASFQNDESLHIWFRSFAAISLLPQQDMNAASEHLHSIKPILYGNKIDFFLEYHDKIYEIKSHFPPRI
jgi:hypothetical protein